MATKRKRLTLKEKIEIINNAEENKLSVRLLAERFKVGKTQVGEILRNKEEINKLWITNANENGKNVKLRKTDSSEIDSIVFNWFSSVRSRNVPVTGPLLQEKALEVGKKLGINDFKASNGWLEKFRSRHNISFKTICGEAKSVDMTDVADWNKRIKLICEGYEDCNIFNADETGLFYRILPHRTMCLKKQECIGEKISKERLTVLLCSNMLGEFQKPLIIGKYLKPRCFKNIDISRLGVVWRANKKAWMTRSLMIEWLTAFNARMKTEQRKVLLFLDNATSHPTDLKFENVKVVFFPPNTTSVCQPLDQGVIRSCKAWYKKLLLRHVIAQLDSSGTLEDFSKSINVLHAITWITSAMKNIKQQSIRQCFKKAGFNFSVNENNALFSDAKNELDDISDLIKCLKCEETAENFLKIDEELCIEKETADVCDFIFPEITTESDCIEDEAVSCEAESDSLCVIKNYQEAAQYSEHLQNFFIKHSDSEGLGLLTDLKLHIENQVAGNHKRRQTILTDFFSFKNPNKVE